MRIKSSHKSSAGPKSYNASAKNSKLGASTEKSSMRDISKESRKSSGLRIKTNRAINHTLQSIKKNKVEKVEI